MLSTEDRLRVCVALLCTSLLLLGCQQETPPELEAYLATIRTSRMSEVARQALKSVAVVRVRQTLLTFEKDEATGYYDRVYRTTACPLPGANPKQLNAWQEKLDQAAAKEIDRIRPLADLNSSGFISTDEGSKFRKLYEMGLEAAFICKREPCTLEALSSATGKPAESLGEALSAYRSLLRRAEALKLDGFPPIPLREQSEERREAGGINRGLSPEAVPTPTSG
jgi:hypothetical protein